ncbi:MAG TPA: hypothetical protein VIJ94_07200 [Caulobacteraceae bacterium]
MALPAPEPGLVISFNYLWRRESEEGREHGRYPRPCAIVIALRTEADGPLIVTVVPITTKEPVAGQAAVAIPLAVKRHLGLDVDRPSWAIVDEVNEFAWPGFDLEPNADGQVAYGFIPPRLYDQVRTKLLETVRARRLGRVLR